MVASCHLPKDDVVIDNRTSAENQDEQASKAAKLYDEEKGEVGGYGTAHAQMGKIEIRMKIRHDGEVNRARYMPQNHFLVASRGPSSPVYVWDLAKHPSFPTDDDDNTILPQITCQGHSKEGYALSWSPLKEGWLASGSEDTTVCLWDTATAKDGLCQATTILKGHTATVEDVDWHAKDANLLASVSDDASLRIWDIREASKPVHLVEKAHESDINCVAFNPQNEYILATGSADNKIGIWDVRNLKRYVIVSLFVVVCVCVFVMDIGWIQWVSCWFRGLVSPAVPRFSVLTIISPTVALILCRATTIKSTWWNGHPLMNRFSAVHRPIVGWVFGICLGLGWNNPPRTPKMVHRNYSFCMVGTPPRCRTFRGILRIHGPWHPYLKTMYCKYGKWQKKFMREEMKMTTMMMEKGKISSWERMTWNKTCNTVYEY
jgi:WD40 repeat protein